MKIERKDVLIMIAGAIFILVSVPGVFFNQAIKRYLDFLGIWAEKPVPVIRPATTRDFPAMHGHGSSAGDFAQPELRFITFSVDINSAGEVSIAGDFNKWKRDSVKLVKKEKNSWETIIPLAPGDYRYVYYVDGRKILDPLNPSTAIYQGEKVSLLTVK